MHAQLEQDNDYVVFSMRMAGYLMHKGCKLIKLRPDKRNPSKWVYFFPNTQFVLDHAEEYQQKREIEQK